MSKYWAHLHANGIDKARLASYDRKITQEPWIGFQREPENVVRSFETYL